MEVRYSIIVATRDSSSVMLAWHRNLARADLQTIIVENPGRMGLGQAFNDGLVAAEGEFCCFIHDDAHVQGDDWLEQLERAVTQYGFDLVGIAGSTRMPRTGGWWDSGRGFGRGSVTHRHQDGRESTDHYGSPDDPNRGMSPVVTLDGVLLFGRRRDFLSAPFDTDLFDGFHFYDSDLSLRWLLWHGRRLGVVHGINVVHRAGASLAGWQPMLDRFHHRHGGFLPLDIDQVPIWQANLSALQQRDAMTAARLTLSRRPGSILGFSLDSHDRLVGKVEQNEFVITDETIQAELKETSSWIVLLGVGDGTRLEKLLQTSTQPILVIEPEGQLVCWHLTRRDWSKAIREGMLRWLIPATDQPALLEMSLHETVILLQRESREKGEPTWIHGGSYSLHADFYNAVQAAAALPRESARLVGTWSTRASSEFAVTVISPRCQIFNDLADTLQSLGCPTRRIDVPDRAEEWSREIVWSVLRELVDRPTPITLLRNRVCLEMPDARQRVGIEPFIPGRIVSWWWDEPTATSRGDWEDPIFRRPALGFAREIVAMLPAGSRWLPPAARSAFTSAKPEFVDDGRDIPMSFVGQSRFDLLRQNLDILGNGLFTHVGMVGVRWAEAINKSSTMNGLYQAITSRRAEMAGAIDRLSLGLPFVARYLDYLLRMAETAAFRLAAVERLRDFPIVVFGDKGWVESGAIKAEQFAGPAAPSALPELYRRSGLNLNFNFMQVSSTVNPKVLDIAGSGNAVLTDIRPELVELFPEPTVRPASFRSLDELPDQVSTLMASDLSSIRERGRAAVLAAHTMKHRAEWLIREYDLPGGEG